MPRKSRQNPEVRDFILRGVEEHPAEIGPMTAKRFGLSRTAVARYVNRLVDEGFLTAEGKTNARTYKLKPTQGSDFHIEISPGLAEDHIFRFRILPLMSGMRQNIIDICQYGFTEMLNNVIDHSGSPDAIISYKQTYTKVRLLIIDRGVGIFEKIQKDFNLADPRSALLELSKGKVTSDAARHSGEGIFFTSRMFDDFQLSSGTLYYTRVRKDDDDWLIETKEGVYLKGTAVSMDISTAAAWTTSEIFARYQEDDILFRRTHVPVRLGKYPGEQLVSRSQAKRVLARFDQFSEVLLDFDGVQQIGQPFADEIFRVFSNSHPETKVVPIRTSPEVRKMIDYVMAAGRDSGVATPSS